MDRHGVLILMDIKGGFNAVWRNPLLNRLREQGWGEAIVQWIGSFCENRTAFATGEHSTAATFTLKRGLPQGSPLSPVLFLLYLTPLFKGKHRFGYVDDIAIYHSSRHPAQAAKTATEDANSCIEWLKRNGVPIALEKTEFLRLAKGKQLNTESIKLLDHLNRTRPAGSVRYLGVWLDPELKFKTHAQKMAQRGQGLANCMKRFNRTLRGLPPAQACKVARACGVATVMYATEAW